LISWLGFDEKGKNIAYIVAVSGIITNEVQQKTYESVSGAVRRKIQNSYKLVVIIGPKPSLKHSSFFSNCDDGWTSRSDH